MQRASAQGGILGKLPNMQGGGSGKSDSLRKRNKFEDSITISFHYLDSTRSSTLDTSVKDYYSRFLIPYTHHYLGNPGAPAYSLLFRPVEKAGFDPGYHYNDIYKWTTEGTRFFTTTRPYTELGFTLGTGGQLFIDLLHTQNLKPYWNISAGYRLVNSPGYFRSQKTVHNNYLLTSWYQSPNKRYNNYFVLLGNKLQNGENGGILDDMDYLSESAFNDRYRVPTRLAPNARTGPDLFSTNINTGNRSNEFELLLRQQFDFGKKDSLVTDSTVIPLFFPRLRIEHTLRFNESKYGYRDLDPAPASYRDFFRVYLPDTPRLLLSFRDQWTSVRNDLSIYTYPDAKNLHQYFQAGAFIQEVTGKVRTGVEFVNTAVYAAYRNQTKNRKWDINAFGQLYLTGYNAADYEARGSLQRLISPRIGRLTVGFSSVLRSPPFVYNYLSNRFGELSSDVKKEHTTHLSGALYVPGWRLDLGADYFLSTNYLYFSNLFTPQQADLVNVLRLRGARQFKVGRGWNWHAEVFLQQKAGSRGVNLPLFLTRNRFQYEGNFGFKNLSVATGVELRYHTPFESPGWSPVNAQFYYREDHLLKNRPDVHAFFHFRIRSFKAFLRAENLNTLRISGSPGFREHNFAADDYPYPGLVLRMSIFWSFVN
jgi:hypothetical protein